MPHLIPFRARMLFAACFVVLGFGVSHAASAATFTVNSTEDSTDGTCTHPYTGAAGDCTLREAVTAANATAPAVAITFQINAAFPDDGSGQWTIALLSAGLSLTRPVTISGASAWDTDRPGIKLTTGAGIAAFSGAANALGSKIQGLEISGFTTGIVVTGNTITVGTDCDGVNDDKERNVLYGATNQEINVNGGTGSKIRGNYIGVQSDGVTPSTFGLRGIQVVGAAADSHLIGYEEGTSAACPAARQRNVFGGGSSATSAAIFVTTGSSIQDDIGSSALAPDHIRISGNYIGVGADGVTDVATAGYGVRLLNGTTLDTIGTDGDGVDDALEGNVISGWTSDGIFVFRTGYSRISGNIVGLAADGQTAMGNQDNGIQVRGQGMVIGWCDAAVSADLCSDAGAVETQRNVVASNGTDGIGIGPASIGTVAYGNVSGTDAASALDRGNGENGVFVHRGNTVVNVGGTGTNRRNVVMHNDEGGILVDGYFTGNEGGATEGYVISNNEVSENDAYGIKLLGTEQDGTAGPTDGEVSGNEVHDNAGPGIVVEGSSPRIDANVIEDNDGYGIHVLSAYRRDEPLSGGSVGSRYSHPTDTLNPSEAAQDAVSEPIISGNAIDGNADGGILIVDADVQNASTLASDNTIGENGAFDIRRDWYAAIELVRPSGNVITDGPTVRLVPAGGFSCTQTCDGSTFADAGSGEGVWGPAGISYVDASTWFQLTDYQYATSGTLQSFNPYEVRIEGSLRLGDDTVTSVTFDGDGSDDAPSTHLAASIATAGADRYQIHEMELADPSQTTFLPPAAPLALTPVALNDGSIRWYFRDQADDETGFRLYAKDEHGERLVADTGNEIVTDLTYFDETGLSAGTEYCGRSVAAFNGTGESFPTSLPCATTLSPGASAESTDIPNIVLTQRILPATLPGHGTFPFYFFGSAALAGTLHLRRMRRRSCSLGLCGRTLTSYLVLGAAGAAGMYLMLAVPISGLCGSNAEQPAFEQYVSEGNETVRVEYVLTNEGGKAGLEAVFQTSSSEYLSVDLGTLRIQANGTDVGRAFVKAADGTLLVELGDIAAGSKWTLSYEAVIGTFSETVVSQASVEGSNFPEVSSNPISVSVPGCGPVYHAPQAFSLVSAPSSTSVYMMDADGTRRPFPNRDTFLSWYPVSAEIQSLADDQLASIPLGRPMLPRPGTWLLKDPDRPTVYALEAGNVLRPIKNERAAISLFGDDWDRQDIPLDPAFFHRFLMGETLDQNSYPDGMAVTDGFNACYVEDGLCRPLSASGQSANRIFSEFIRPTTTEQLNRLKRSEPLVMAEERLLTDYWKVSERELEIEVSAAKIALGGFLSALHEARYEDAVVFFGGDYAQLQAWNPDVTPDLYAKLWRNGCEVNGLRCAEMQAIELAEHPDKDTYVFDVSFFDPDGSGFSLRFVVSRVFGQEFLVQTMP